MGALAQVEAAPDVGIVGDGLDSDWAVARQMRYLPDAGTLQFDASDPPPAGMGCWFCSLGQPAVEGVEARRHHCLAKGYFVTDGMEYPVCEKCGVGEICGQAAAVARMREGLPEFGEFEEGQGRDPGHSVAIEPGDVREAPAPAESDWKIKGELSADNLRLARLARRKLRPGQREDRPGSMRLAAPGRQCIGCGTPLSGHLRGEKCAACRRRSCGCGAPLSKRTQGDQCRRCRNKAAASAAAAKRLEEAAAKLNEKARNDVAKRISDAVRGAVLAEPDTMSYNGIANKHPIGWLAVQDIRGPRAKRDKPAKTVAAGGAPGRALAPRSAAIARLPARAGRGQPPGEPVATVMLNVPEPALDRILLAATLDNKARAVQFLLNEGLA